MSVLNCFIGEDVVQAKNRDKKVLKIPLKSLCPKTVSILLREGVGLRPVHNIAQELKLSSIVYDPNHQN